MSSVFDIVENTPTSPSSDSSEFSFTEPLPTFRRMSIQEVEEDDQEEVEHVEHVENVKQVEPAHHHNKIILLLMIKNESRIIERCLEHALPHVDGVAILDTGSTDDTVEICEKYLASKGKPFKIAVEPFKNFGYNRTASFLNAQALCTELAWDAEKTYAMAVDADMNIVVNESFKDFEMTFNGYTIIQDNGHLKYSNLRFMKCSYAWKCIGATHEYWSGDPSSKIPYEVIHIDDRNDGGCKSDKFERDLRLLSEEAEAEPNNPRTFFYLGQTLKDLGRFNEAIEKFTRRIEIGGWYEEVWYSHYQIGKCYGHMNEPYMMELWMNKAYDYRPCRAEPLYHMTQYFREKSQHYKAYHYYLKGRHIPFPKDDALFIEDGVYHGLFDYENTILACWVNGKTKQDSLMDMVNYINKNIPYSLSNVWDNIHYYTESLTSPTYKGEYMRLPFQPLGDYVASSCSILPYSADPNRRFVMNVRYVNYSIDERGYYHMRDPDNVVRTKNAVTFLNDSGYPTEDVKLIQEDLPESYDHNIQGLEDVRLFWHNGRVKFTASSKNLSKEGNIVIAMGDYHSEQQRINNISVIRGPYHSGCEKNWISCPPLSSVEASRGKLNFIYGWGPMEIGALNQETQQVEIHTKYETPALFNRFRGSSGLVEHLGHYYAVTHFVQYTQPRHYYHSVVRFNKDTLKPEAYSAPFTFCEFYAKIEYCLGFYIKDSMAWFAFSRNDCDSSMIRLPLANLRFIPI